MPKTLNRYYAYRPIGHSVRFRDDSKLVIGWKAGVKDDEQRLFNWVIHPSNRCNGSEFGNIMFSFRMFIQHHGKDIPADAEFFVRDNFQLAEALTTMGYKVVIY